MRRTPIIIVAILTMLVACSNGGGRAGEGVSPNIEGFPETPLTIHDESQLIGGPLGLGRIGDVLLQNDQIRVIIQKPGKNAGLGSFGGTIIDADLVGGSGDQFGEIFPLINIEWTVNYYNYEVIEDEKAKGTKILRAFGRIDVYDYLDVDFIADAAEGIAGQKLSFSNRFDDRRDPFAIYEDLKGINPEVVTDYILEPGKRFVRMETTLANTGKTPVRMPVGMFLNGSGALSLLIPGQGFSPDPATQIGSHTPAVIFQGYDGVPVSYGFFYDPREFLDKDGKVLSTASITYAGLTGIIFGEGFLKLLPLGSAQPPEIAFTIPENGTRKLTSFFVVGDGTAGSVFEAGLEALGISTVDVTGTVVDAKDQPVAGAMVAFQNKGGGTVTAVRSDGAGRFQAKLPFADTPIASAFGKGIYAPHVELAGFHKNGTTSSGECLPAELNVAGGEVSLRCRLGEAGKVIIAGPAVEKQTKKRLAARLTIVGQDPSPNAAGKAGIFYDTDLLSRPFGISDVKFITAQGTIGLTEAHEFALEPGVYRFVFSHGTEYGIHEQVAEVKAGEAVTLLGVEIPRAIETPGYVSADFHIHMIHSPDSSFSVEGRALSASAEGLDVLQSSDHDFLTNFAPYVEKLMQAGAIPIGSMTTSIGNEITPNHYGHIHAFPLEHHPDDVAGGALDWTDSKLDEISTAPDYAMGLSEIIKRSREDPGEEVIQINHIADNITSITASAGWVTTPFYAEGFGVVPLSTYADPIERRLLADGVSPLFPKPFGSSDLISIDIDAVELTIGQQLHAMDKLLRSALPTWFNFLNLGVLMTATGNSDSHTEVKTPLGLPRNFVASSVDPSDGQGTDHSAIDLEEFATNINEGRVVVSAGPFVEVIARGKESGEFRVGDTIPEREVKLTIRARAPSWAWFDTIEIYANTEPIPVDDKTGSPMAGNAADPAAFYNPNHVPQYTYQPTKTFRLLDGTLKNFEEKEGVIRAEVEVPMTFDEDAWLVVLVRGTRETKGYRSLFPLVPEVLRGKTEPEGFDPADLAAFHASSHVGAPAWALANPIFVDVDGNGFQSKYVRDGRSPVPTTMRARQRH